MRSLRRPIASTRSGSIVALVLLSWGGGTSPSAALDAEFWYSAALEESRLSDVFRTGGEGQGDYVTRASVTSGWSARTARSTLSIEYTPAYFEYARLSELNHLEHAERTRWSFDLGPRSMFRLGQAFVAGEEQRGLLDVSEEKGEVIQERGRRWVADLTPGYSVALSRRVSLDVGGAYRLSRYEREDLVDSDQVGARIAPTVQVGRASRIGGILSGDSFEFGSGVEVGGRYESFVRLEALWSRSNGRGLDGSVSAGVFRGSGSGLDTAVEPSLRLGLSYQAAGNQVAVSYDLGYSTNPQAARVLRTRSGSLQVGRQWRSGLRTNARAGYLQQDPLEESQDDAGRLDGYGLDLDVAYTWKNGVGLGVRYSRLSQDRLDASDLDYATSTVSLRYQPVRGAERSAAPRERPGS